MNKFDKPAGCLCLCLSALSLFAAVALKAYWQIFIFAGLAIMGFTILNTKDNVGTSNQSQDDDLGGGCEC